VKQAWNRKSYGMIVEAVEAGDDRPDGRDWSEPRDFLQI
jgi:hypothetical protein